MMRRKLRRVIANPEIKLGVNNGKEVETKGFGKC